MRRPNPKPYTIQEIYPFFFWQKCDLCHEEFKKEIAWKINFRTTSRIVCSQCAGNYYRAEELALTWGETGCDKPSVKSLIKKPIRR